jgi:trans-aconitate methyltransferase
MFTINEIIPKSVVSPIHVRDYHIPLIKQYYIENRPIYITPKIDGVHCSVNYEGLIYECEKLGTDVYVIDIIKKSNAQSFYMTLRIIEKKFGRNIIYQPSTSKKLLSNLKSFNIETKHDNIKLKPFFLIKKDTFGMSEWEDLLEILTIECSMPYLNDGWIMYLEGFKNPLKFKPVEHLTIDILYDSTTKKCYSYEKNEIDVVNNFTKNTSIMRCYWKNCRWLAKEIRHDKQMANKQFIISTLELMHNDYPNYKLIWNNDIELPYYQHELSKSKLLSRPIKDFLTEMRDLTFDIIKCNIEQKDKMKILDIGCGKGKLGKYLSKHFSFLYSGIDVDPLVLSNTCHYGVYYWNNINDKELKLNKADYVIFVNSFHYVDDKCNVLKKLSEITNTLIIFGIFEDYYMKEINNELVKVTKNDGKFMFNYAWKNSDFTEKVLNKKDVIETANMHGFVIKTTKKFDIINDFYDLHELLVFVRSS